MATATTYLGLTKMTLNELINGWGDELNDNFDILDTAVGELQILTSGSEGSFATLSDRLDASDASLAVGLGFGDVGDWGYPSPLTAPTLGPISTVEQSRGSQVVHSIQRSLLDISEPSSVTPTIPLSHGRASGWLKRGAHVTGAFSAGGDAVSIDFGVAVNPAYVFCDGLVGKLRAGAATVNVPIGGLALDRRWLVGTVGLNSALTGTAGTTQNTNEFHSAEIDWSSVEAGDLLQITTADAELQGTYLIASVDSGADTCDIRGPAWLKEAGSLAFTVHRRGWITITDTADASIAAVYDGVAYNAAGVALGTLLGHVDKTSPGNQVVSANIAEYAFGDTYDTGWQPAATFFDGNSPLVGTPETKTVPFPDVPLGGFQLLWSSDSAGAGAVQVPPPDLAAGHGCVMSWTKNVLAVNYVDVNSVLKDDTGTSVVGGAGAGQIDNGYFRLIARR